MRRSTSARTALRAHRRTPMRIIALAGAAILMISGSVLTVNPPAFATSYPTWADVLAARKNASAAQAEVTKIKALLSSLNSQLTAANTKATQTGEAAAAAEQKYTLAADKEKTLQLQEQAAAAKADKTKKQLGTYASQLARGPGSGGWSTFSILLNGKSEGQLLNNLGAVNQVSQADDHILQTALDQQKTVKQLTALASAQAGILNKQKQAADAAKAAAAAAAANLQAAVTAEAAHQQELTVELQALTTKLTMTETQYDAGVAAAEGAQGGGAVDSAGWALPTVGVITSPYGYRYDPAQGYRWAMHWGDDIAHGCLQGIYAATGGTVVYAGIYSDYGNYIMIDHGGGVETAYGHIANGETFVHVGQSVAAGQNIARTGSTGASTGCHLYFAVMVNGSWVNPVPFMAARGITLGIP